MFFKIIAHHPIFSKTCVDTYAYRGIGVIYGKSDLLEINLHLQSLKRERETLPTQSV
jgi:hypothetical protein